MSSLHAAIPTPSFCSFWHGHPYIPIHFLKMFFILYTNVVQGPMVDSTKVKFTKDNIQSMNLE